MTESQRLVDALTAAGWQKVSGREGLYVRLAVVEDGRRRLEVTVPFGPEYADYDDLMDAVVGMLERLYFDGRAARTVLARFKPDLHFP